MKKILFIFVGIYSFNLYALVGVGGYVPFGFSTQRDAGGGVSPFHFQPYVALNTSLQLSGPHYFLPEIGYVKHTSLKDDYSKSTIFLLYDGGYLINRLMIRYGIGVFITRISGDGKEITQRNGSTGTAPFYAPDQAITSHNSTINFGAEYGITNHFSFKVENYLFSILSSDKRDISYSLSLNYYM